MKRARTLCTEPLVLTHDAVVTVSIPVGTMTVTVSVCSTTSNYPNQEATQLCNVFSGDLSKHTFPPRYGTDCYLTKEMILLKPSTVE